MSRELPPTIALVDDDPEVRRVLAAMLKRLPAEVIEYDSGDAAVDGLLERHKAEAPVDLGILDMWVPRQRGGQIERTTGRRLVLLSCWFQIFPPHVPLIVFTAHENFEDAVDCMRAGARSYLPKTELSRNNVERLVDLCRRLLYPQPEADPRQEWLKDHWNRLLAEFPGRQVAIIDPKFRQSAETAAAKSQPPLPCHVVDGYVLVAAQEARELGLMMLGNPELRWEKPYIVWVPPTQDNYLR